MKKTAKIFAVITLLLATLGAASAHATGPYLGTALQVTPYRHGAQTISLAGKTIDVHAEAARLRYALIKEGKLQGFYFFESGTEAVAKLYVSEDTNPYIKIYEFYGSEKEVQEKADSMINFGYEISFINNIKCTAYKINRK